MSESESSLRTMGFCSAVGLGLFLAILEISRAFLFPLALAVGFALGFLLIGFFVGSDLLVPMSGKSTLGSAEGLGSKTCKGIGGSALA